MVLGYDEELIRFGFKKQKVYGREVYTYETPLISLHTEDSIVVNCYEQDGKVYFSSGSALNFYHEELGDRAIEECREINKQLKGRLSLEDMVLRMEVDTDENIYFEMNTFVRMYIKIEEYFEEYLKDEQEF